MLGRRSGGHNKTCPSVALLEGGSIDLITLHKDLITALADMIFSLPGRDLYPKYTGVTDRKRNLLRGQRTQN